MGLQCVGVVDGFLFGFGWCIVVVGVFDYLDWQVDVVGVFFDDVVQVLVIGEVELVVFQVQYDVGVVFGFVDVFDVEFVFVL